MKKTPIFLSLILTLLLLPVLSSCGKNGGSISMEQLENYIIVQQADASDELEEAAANLQKGMKVSLGIEIELTEDASSESSNAEYEILIGNCNRDEAAEFAKELRKDDWGYNIIGNKVVIYGGSDETTLKALQSFTKYIVRQHDESSTVFFDSASDAKLELGTYTIDTLTLQGTDIYEYTIVYPADSTSDESLAKWVASKISEYTGHILTVTDDTAESTGKEILIGTTNRTDCSYTSQSLGSGTYIIGADKTYICLRGADSIGTYYGVKEFITTLFTDVSSKHTVKFDASSVRNIPTHTKLTSMSFNIYTAAPNAQRKASVIQTILNEFPDVFGVQEASVDWMGYLNESLGDYYEYVGQGRDGGENGDYCAVFYRKDRFELIDDDTKWLSQSPNVVSRFPDSDYLRIVTYAILQDKHTNTEFIFANTHLDLSPEVRNKQVNVLLKQLDKLGDYPIVLTGDFNDNPMSEMYGIVTEQFTDSSKIATEASLSHTFHNWGAASTLMDYIFVSEDSIDVSSYKVITDEENGMLPSDHFPVYIECQINN